MTIHELPNREPLPTARRPPRRGERWTDDDYTTLVRLAREGVTEAQVCEALGRNPSAVQLRARRLLPLDQRGVPGDRVVQHLGELAGADEDYPWATHLAATPPPRPVVQHIHPPANHAGVKGLRDAELVAIAAALSWRPDSNTHRDITAQIADLVVDRGLTSRLHRAVEESSSELVEALLDRAHRYGGARWDSSPWGEPARTGRATWGGESRWDEGPASYAWPEEPPSHDEPPFPEELEEPPFA